MADEDPAPEAKDASAAERRVYTLPARILERLRAYQLRQNLPSEAEAVRRLLDLALQIRDNIEDILEYLGSKFVEERDIRTLIGEYVAKHALVSSVMFHENYVEFYLKNGQGGRIDTDGTLFIRQSDDDDEWKGYTLRKDRRPTTAKRVAVTAPQWGPAKGGELDDEIPF